MKVLNTKLFPILLLIVLFLNTGGLRAENVDQGPINVTITGVGVEGMVKVVVESMSAVLRDAYPGSVVTFKPSSPAGGLKMISEGTADISLAAGSPEVAAALDGAPPFQSSLKGKFSNLIQLFDGQVFMFLASQEWADKYGIRTFDDIAQKKPPLRVAINRQGNMQIVEVAKDILKAHAISVEDIAKHGGAISWAASNVGLDQLADGKVDMFLNARFFPDANITRIANAKKLVWIQADIEKLKTVSTKWSYPIIMIPANTFDFEQKDVHSINQWSNVSIGNHVSAETAYKIIKALNDNADKMKVVHPALKEFSAASMAKILDTKLVPLHPGAIRFFQERGLLAK